MSHQWSGWPGAICTRCGSEQVLELALGEDWLAFDEHNNEQWKSPDHQALVNLCDGACYADMTTAEQEAHKAKIKVLCDKIGYPPKKDSNGPHVG